MRWKLIHIYPILKFHRNPIKMRFIAGSRNTSTSDLNRILANILKMCKDHFRNLCNKNQGFDWIRRFFDVETSSEVQTMLDSLSGNARSISINDFSTLYTLFDHGHLIGNTAWLLDRLSINAGKKCNIGDFRQALKRCYRGC